MHSTTPFLTPHHFHFSLLTKAEWFSRKPSFSTALDSKFAVRSTKIEKPGKGEILVKSLAVALNPIDWKIPVYKLPFVKNFPAILGSDTAGTS